MTSTPITLWNTVLLTRRAVADHRNLPSSIASKTAGARLLAALEAYEHGLLEESRPVPPALRDELRLLRLTNTADRRYYGAVPLRRPT